MGANNQPQLSGYSYAGQYSWDRYDRIIFLAERQKFSTDALYRQNLDVIISKIFNLLSTAAVDTYKMFGIWYPILSYFYFSCDSQKITSDKPLIEMFEIFCQTLNKEKSCQTLT